MKKILLAVLPTLVFAQQLPPPQKEIPIYPGVAPGSEKWDWSERQIASQNGMPIVQNVVRPVLQYYPGDKTKATGTAMITPITPNKSAPERKQNITSTGCTRAAVPSASGPNS